MTFFSDRGGTASRVTTYPGQPWRWRADWDEGRIPSTTRGSMRSAWFVAVFWNLVCSPLLFLIPREWPDNRLAAIGLVLPLAGVWFVAVAVRLTLRRRRFGETWFAMMPVPASPGGRLQGTLHARLPIDRGVSPPALVLQLTCLRRVARQGSDEPDVSEPIVWRDEHEISTADLASGPAGCTIPVAFDLPIDALETTGAGDGPGVFWVLTARASWPGVDFHEEYDVPVHRTGTSSAPRVADAVRPRRVAPPSVTADDLARTGIDVATRDGELEVRCGAARNRSFLIGMTAFLAIWSGAWYLQYVLGVPWIIQGMTLVFEALFVVLCVDLWFSTTTVCIGAGRVSRRYAVAGIGATKTWAARDVTALTLTIGSQTQGRTGTPYYDIRATLATGRAQTLVPRIRDKRHAEWLSARMREALGVDAAAVATTAASRDTPSRS